MEEFDESTAPLNSHSWFSIGDLFENYGWYILAVAIVCLYIYRQLQPTIERYQKNKADQEYAAKYHKDPDMATARIAAQQAAIKKLQEQYDNNAEDSKRKAEEKEARKRDEWLLRQNTHGGQKLGGSSQSLRSEYNPLMGDTSRSYRPQKKSSCAGGGCGKK